MTSPASKFRWSILKVHTLAIWSVQGPACAHATLASKSRHSLALLRSVLRGFSGVRPTRAFQTCRCLFLVPCLLQARWRLCNTMPGCRRTDRLQPSLTGRDSHICRRSVCSICKSLSVASRGRGSCAASHKQGESRQNVVGYSVMVGRRHPMSLEVTPRQRRHWPRVKRRLRD